MRFRRILLMSAGAVTLVAGLGVAGGRAGHEWGVATPRAPHPEVNKRGEAI